MPTDDPHNPVLKHEEERFVGHAVTVSALTLVSRFGGLVRDAVCSRVFGAGPIWSAFAFAFLVPNLFRRLFGEGASSAAFLPEYARLQERDPAAARRLAGLVVACAAIVLGSLTVVGEVVFFVLWQTSGGAAGAAPSGLAGEVMTTPETRSLVLTLLMVMLPYMPLICLVALVGAMLQTHRRFGPTAAAPIILNICMIVAACYVAFSWQQDSALTLRRGIVIVAASVVIAGIVQLAWSVLALRGTGAFGSLNGAEFGGETRERASSMFRLLVPMLIGLGVLQLNTLFDGLIASYPVWFGSKIAGAEYPLDLQSNAVLFYAQRLYQFPLGVFGIAVATAIFPALARSASRSRDELHDILQRGIRLTVYIGLPASIGLILVRTPLVTVILRGYEFTDDDAARVAAVLLAYAPAVWAYSLNQVLTRACYACEDANSPLRIALGMVVLNLVLNIALIWVLRSETGLAWATSICATIQSVLLLRACSKHAGHAINADVLRAIARMLASSIVMAVTVIAIQLALETMWPLGSWTSHLVHLLTATVAGACMYIFASWMLGADEWKWLVKRHV